MRSACTDESLSSMRLMGTLVSFANRFTKSRVARACDPSLPESKIGMPTTISDA